MTIGGTMDPEAAAARVAAEIMARLP